MSPEYLRYLAHHVLRKPASAHETLNVVRAALKQAIESQSSGGGFASAQQNSQSPQVHIG
jgi:hypothetical protein